MKANTQPPPSPTASPVPEMHPGSRKTSSHEELQTRSLCISSGTMLRSGQYGFISWPQTAPFPVSCLGQPSCHSPGMWLQVAGPSTSWLGLAAQRRVPDS